MSPLRAIVISISLLVVRPVHAAVPAGFTKLGGVQEVSPGVCSISVKLESPTVGHIGDADIIQAEFKGDRITPMVLSLEPLMGGGNGSASLKQKASVTLDDFNRGRSLNLPFPCERGADRVAAYGLFVCVISKFDGSAQRCADAYAVNMERRSKDVRLGALSTSIEFPDKLFVLKNGAPELGGSKTYFFGALFRDGEGAFYLPPDFPYQEATAQVREFLSASKVDSNLIERTLFKGGELERSLGSFPMITMDGGAGILIKLPRSR